MKRQLPMRDLAKHIDLKFLDKVAKPVAQLGGPISRSLENRYRNYYNRSYVNLSEYENLEEIFMSGDDIRGFPKEEEDSIYEENFEFFGNFTFRIIYEGQKTHYSLRKNLEWLKKVNIVTKVTKVSDGYWEETWHGPHTRNRFVPGKYHNTTSYDLDHKKVTIGDLMIHGREHVRVEVDIRETDYPDPLNKGRSMLEQYFPSRILPIFELGVAARGYRKSSNGLWYIQGDDKGKKLRDLWQLVEREYEMDSTQTDIENRRATVVGILSSKEFEARLREGLHVYLQHLKEQCEYVGYRPIKKYREDAMKLAEAREVSKKCKYVIINPYLENRVRELQEGIDKVFGKGFRWKYSDVYERGGVKPERGYKEAVDLVKNALGGILSEPRKLIEV